MRRLLAAFALAAISIATLAQDAPPKPVDSLSDFKDGKGTLSPVGTIAARALGECSGLVWHDGAWWAHNDSGDGPNLFRAATPDFSNAEMMAVPGAKNVDWEEITVFGGDLLVCDVGDNARKRDDATLYRVKYDAREDGTSGIKLLATYPVTWPDEPHDCEAAATIDGKLHLVTKDRGEGTGLYRFGELKDGGKNVPELVAKLDVGPKAMITGACFDAASGNLILLGYTRIYVYPKDKLQGAPAWSTRIEANQCEAVCLKDGTLHFCNEQRDVYAVAEFLERKPASMLPPRVKVELPFEETAYQPDGTGATWKSGAAALPLTAAADGQFLRWMISGPNLLVAGSLTYAGAFTTSDERGNRLQSGMWFGISTEAADLLTGKETLLFVGEHLERGMDVWSVDLKQGIKLERFTQATVKGKVASGTMLFEFSIPLTALFGLGKLPSHCLANAWGYGLQGRVEARVAGSSVMSMTRPYTWADVTIKQP